MARAQNDPNFDPIATAKLRAGEIAREITASARDASGAETSPAQKTIALKSIELATQQLRNAGYTSLAARVNDWLRKQ
jgi:hypothetical protein